MKRKQLLILVAMAVMAAPAFAQIGIFDASMDIDGGRLGAAGSASYDPATDTYTVTGSGHDIWDDKDNFHFLYMEWSGDFDVRANISIEGGLETQPWIKSMIMARQNLTPGSPNIGNRVRRDGQYSTQWRQIQDDTNSKASTAADQRVTLAELNGGRLRFVRQGDQFSTYYLDSMTGDWVQVDSAYTFQLEDPFYLGFAVTAHDVGELATGKFSDVEILQGSVGIFENQVTLDSAHNAHVVVPGSASYSDGVYTISGNGHDIWEAGDEGFFIYNELSGSNSISGRVKWIQAKGGSAGGNDWAKIGVMARDQGDDPASSHYWIEMRCGAGDPALGDRTDAQWRPTFGAASLNQQIFEADGTTDVAQQEGLWLRVTRNADTDEFISEYSYDGSNWVVAHTLTVAMEDPVAYGIIITSHTDDDQIVIAEVSDVTLGAPSGTDNWELLK